MDFRRILFVSSLPTKGDNWTLYVVTDAVSGVSTFKYWDYSANDWATVKLVADAPAAE